VNKKSTQKTNDRKKERGGKEDGQYINSTYLFFSQSRTSISCLIVGVNCGKPWNKARAGEDKVWVKTHQTHLG